MIRVLRKGFGVCHPFKMANQITRRSSLYYSRTVATAENRLPHYRCLPFALSTMVIRPRFGTLDDLFLLSRVYTDGSCKIGVLRSFERNNAGRKGFSNRTCEMARYCSSFDGAFSRATCTVSPIAIPSGLTNRALHQQSEIGSINVLHSLGGRRYSTKSFVKRLISTLSCCFKPAADVMADQTGEISALQTMTRQMEEVDITSGEEITSQRITHVGEASTSQTLPIVRPKLSLFHSIMRREITGPCEQRKDSFLVAELAERFVPDDPRFILCREYVQIIDLRERCEKGLLPTFEEFKLMSFWPSLTWSSWLSRELQNYRMNMESNVQSCELSAIEYEEILFCFKSIRRIGRELFYSSEFLHPLLECLVRESSKRAFSFQPTLEEACEILHTKERKILSPAQERHHALKFSDLLNNLAYWEERIMATVLHRTPAILFQKVSDDESSISFESELRGVPLRRVNIFLRKLMLESEGQETLRISSVFEPMTSEGILFVIGGFLILAMALFLFFRWLWLKLKPIRIPRTLFKHEVLITKQGLIFLESKIRIFKKCWNWKKSFVNQDQ